MRSARQGAIPSELGWLIDELDGLAARLSTLEAPSGEALSSTVRKLQDLVTNIQTTLDSYMASRYTNAQIDSFIAGRAPASHTHDQSQVTGTWTKGVSTSDGITAQGAIFFANAYATDLTGTRRTAWLQSDGRLGYASSTRSKKATIEPASIDPAAVLKVEPKTFIYRQEVRRRTDERINNGVDYVPAREVGFIAEDVVEAGLAPFALFDADGKIEGVEYAMWPVALQAVARAQAAEIAALKKANADLDARLKKIESSSVFVKLGL